MLLSFPLIHALNHPFRLFLRHARTDGKGEFGGSKELGDGEGELREVPGFVCVAFLFVRSYGIMDDGADTALLKIIMQRIALSVLHNDREEVIDVKAVQSADSKYARSSTQPPAVDAPHPRPGTAVSRPESQPESHPNGCSVLHI